MEHTNTARQETRAFPCSITFCEHLPEASIPSKSEGKRTRYISKYPLALDKRSGMVNIAEKQQIVSYINNNIREKMEQ